MTQVSLGSFGSVTVDDSKFNETVKNYIFAYGLKQVLNDAHASVNKKTEPDMTDEARNAAKVALAEKKLASLYAGNVAQARASRGDAIARMAWTLAEAFILAQLPKIGKKRSQFKTPVWNAVVEKQLEANRADYMARAKAAVGDETPDVEDLEDLFDVDPAATESDEDESGDDMAESYEETGTKDD